MPLRVKTNNMKKLTFLFIVVIFAGCSPCKRLARKCPPQETYIETVKWDTVTLVSPADTFVMYVPYDPVTLEDLGFMAKSSTAEVEIKVVEKMIYVRVICPEDSLKAVIANLEKQEIKTIKVPEPYPEKFVPKICKIALWFSGIVILVIIGYVVKKLRFRVGRG